MRFLWFFLPGDEIKLFLLALVFFLSFFGCYFYDKYNEISDPSFIVIDEVVGMWIGLFFIPNNFIFYLIAFLLFRFFDILKPSFVYHSQNIPFGVFKKQDNSKIIQGEFSLKNLSYFIKCTNLCSQIEIYLENDLPLVVKYNVASLGEIKLCLAPLPSSH